MSQAVCDIGLTLRCNDLRQKNGRCRKVANFLIGKNDKSGKTSLLRHILRLCDIGQKTTIIDWNSRQNRCRKKVATSLRHRSTFLGILMNETKLIKAIETRYKGYRFRSRLESRWAVFMDAIGQRWEYEPEGYQLKSGMYLPDFYLPDIDVWMEIKPTKASQHEEKLMEQLCYHTNKVGFMCEGLPNHSAIRPFIGDIGSSSAGVTWWEQCWLCQCYDNPGPGIKIFLWTDKDLRTPQLTDDAQCMATNPKTIDDQYFNAAKAARFEHGESGATL